MAFDPHYRFVRSIVADTDGPDQELATDFKVERIEPDPTNRSSHRIFKASATLRVLVEERTTETWIQVV